jgi:hypothetical protein
VTQTRIGAMPRARRVRIGEEGGRDVYLFSVTAPVSRSGTNTHSTYDHLVAGAVQLPHRIEGRFGIIRGASKAANFMLPPRSRLLGRARTIAERIPAPPRS